MIKNRKIAVVIPCYKVSKQIKNVLVSIPSFVDFIIVVDDSCPEKSGKIAEDLKKDIVSVIYHTHNQGVGAAVISGYQKALALKSDIIIKLDGDGQMDPEKIELLIEPLIQGNADYTKGNRFHNLNTLKSMPKTRLFGNSFLSFFIKCASGYWNIMDPTNGFCAITSETVKSIHLGRIEKRYFFESDMLIHLNINDKVVKDVSISANYNNEISNLSIVHSLISFPLKIIKGLVKRLFFKYYIYDFNMASIYMLLAFPLLLFGASFGAYRWITGYLENSENNPGTIMLVALPIILGIQFLLQAIHIDINSTPKKEYRSS